MVKTRVFRRESTSDAQPEEASNPRHSLARSRPSRDPATDRGTRLREVRTAKGGLEYSYSHEAKVKGPHCFIATVSLCRALQDTVTLRARVQSWTSVDLDSATLLEKRRQRDPGGYDGGGEGAEGGTVASALRSTGALSTRKRAVRGTSTHW